MSISAQSPVAYLGTQSMSSKILKVGTEITCPDCNDLIATVAVEIVPGMILSTEYFTFIQEGHVQHAPARCKKCSAGFIRYPLNKVPDFTQIHTKDGWR